MKKKPGNPQFPGSREQALNDRYGITEEAYKTLLEAQHFGCKICGAPYMDKARSNLSVDHCHKTGKIRGLLCGRCNSMLGYADDNPTILLKAIQYLKGRLTGQLPEIKKELDNHTNLC